MYVTKMRAEAETLGKEATTFSCKFSARDANCCGLRDGPLINLKMFDLLPFADDQLILTCLDCFFPTLSTVPVTVAMLVQHIFTQPEIQVKIQNEIDGVVGQGRLPTLDDRVK